MRQPTYDKNIVTPEVLQSLFDYGFTCKEIADKFGVSSPAIIRAANNFGIKRRIKKKGVSQKRGQFDVTQKYLDEHRQLFERFFDLHNQGKTYTEIAEICGCSLFTVGKIMRVFGYTLSTEYKTKAAHDAVRGSKRTLEDLEKRAKGKEKTPPAFSRWEILFRDFLISRGIDFVPSKAIGKYNVDFAIGDSVAVELYGGAFHSTGRAAARLHERMEYLINSGWNVYIIWCLSNESTIFPSCLNDFIAFLERARRNESPVGQYRVIWSDGDFISAGSLEPDYLAVVKPARFRYNALCKYKTARN